MVYMYHSFLIHSSADGHIGGFHVLAIINSGRRGGWHVLREHSETSMLSRVKQITSPGWMHETSAQGWCTGKTQRDGMGREAGGGNRTHVNPWLIHVNVWQKPLQYCKVISLQLIKINGKK